MGLPQWPRSCTRDLRYFGAPALADQPCRQSPPAPCTYMPALVAVQRDPFYEALQNRHKAKPQALMAVMRKLLHAIYGIFRSETAYEGGKLFPALVPALLKA